MDIQKAIGRRIRDLRKRAGLTQAELAARCGRNIEMQRIGEIERGERNSTLRTIERLAKGLRCEPAELPLFRPQGCNQGSDKVEATIGLHLQAAGPVGCRPSEY